MSGLEIGIEEIKTVGRNGLVIAVFGTVFSFFFGYIVGHIMGYEPIVSIAIGNIFVATSVGITVRTLMEMQALRSKVGELILASAVLDDVFGIIILSVTLGQGKPLILFSKIIIFFVSFIVLLFLIRKIGKVKLYIPRFIFTSAIAFAFIFSALAESLGLATIVGSFFAGLVLSNLPQKRRMIAFTRQIGNIFFIPLFFVWVGASFDFHALEDIGILVLFFIPMALMGKIIGCSLGAKISRLKGKDALVVGIGMMPRMEVALVIVSTEVAREIFAEPLAHQIMAGTILLVIVSSLLTPILLKLVYQAGRKNNQRGNLKRFL